MVSPVIQLENFQFRWPLAQQDCLDIDSLVVMPGEHVFLHGPSGSGKSTLLGILGGVHIPQTGAVTILGQQLNLLKGTARDRFRADHIGFLFQQFNLIPYLSVLENVLLPCRFSQYRRNNIKGDMAQEAHRLLKALDIHADLWLRPVTALSVGQQQRVAAARALIGKPEIIIADEPTSSLDAQRQRAFLDLLMQECATASATLMFVSHDQRLAASFDRKVALDEINRVSRQT
ncbi:ABC transporter ATP-binding protein [Methylobacillus arboreus]|uniref:ABC transporter ATP-binding protein n=1 Tax=Methylobacillus arboreus TaxID=755170 RepID=UPI001E58FAC9|nr:ABC transporter ATP-binding protein [Methylobacillus arboreus]MCB5190777.1 ABC transporter ATP-binding protein [Methylobacillus arboreus]